MTDNVSLYEMIIGLIVTAGGAMVTSSRHTSNKIDKIKDGYVRKDDYHHEMANVQKTMTRMDQKLDRLIERDHS